MLDSASSADSGDTPGETLTWRVEGMDCASCVAKVLTAVERLPGISSVEVNLIAERLTLHRSADGAAPAAVERQIGALGLPSNPACCHGTGSTRTRAARLG